MKFSYFTFIIWLSSIFANAGDCGIAPKGTSFRPNCEMQREVATPAPKKQSSAPVATVSPKKNWELAQVGSYSGKIGYFVNIGTDFGLRLDALIMNESAMTKIQNEFATAKLGEIKTCQLVGLQQSAAFSIFDIQNCK